MLNNDTCRAKNSDERSRATMTLLYEMQPLTRLFLGLIGVYILHFMLYCHQNGKQISKSLLNSMLLISLLVLYCVFATFSCGVLSQVYYLIVSIPYIFSPYLL